MKNRSNLNNILSTDRKTLYIVLSIVIISVLTLTVVYAALSTTLNINGNAEVSAASWDIYLDNVVLNSSSATTTAPTITNSKTATFSTTLTKPGDFYEFTIDVVNNGSIDAMIDSVTKTPTLTETQAKYLNYIVEYQNGEAITTKQLVAKNSFVRLKVKVEFRKDITALDLPTTSETLNLAFTVNYVQSDETGTNITDNGIYDPYKVGNEICIGEECFYVISSDEDSVTMLAKYNLHVGNVCTSSSSCTPIENPLGLQDSEMIGRPSDSSYPRYGTTAFSSIKYWWDSTNNNFKSGYPADFELDGIALPYIYNSDSLLYSPVENYRAYLESQGANIKEARLIKLSELVELGCSVDDFSCASAPEWVYGTSYWSGSVLGDAYVWDVYSTGGLGISSYAVDAEVGVRPVIVLKS